MAILTELDLVSLDRDLPALTVRDAERTALERSATYRATMQRYEDGRRWLTATATATRQLQTPRDTHGGAAWPRRRGRRGRRRLPVDGIDASRRRRAGAPRRPHRHRARAARRPVRDRRGARRREHAARSTATQVERRSSSPASTTPTSGASRARSSSSTRSAWRRSAPACGSTPRRCAPRCCTTPSRTRPPRSRRSARAFGEEVAAPRRRRHQAHRPHLLLARRGAGRELPQDDGRDGLGHPGHPDQARRPPAQHAHDRRDAEAEADREGEGDARHLRADRASARHPRDQVGARGPRVRDAAPAQVRGDQGPGQPAARRARALRQRGRRVPAQRARRARHRRRDLRPRQALLLDLLEDDQKGPRVQRDLRPHRDARDRRLGEGLLRRRRRHPLAVEAAARPLQGLHRDAQVQHVPVAAHDGDRARGAAAGDPDPHARDARHGRVRRSPRTGSTSSDPSGRRGRRQAASWLRSPARLAAGDVGPQGVHGHPEGRPVRGRGLRLHAQGRGQVAARRARRRWTSPTRSTPTSATAASARRSTARSCRCPTS